MNLFQDEIENQAIERCNDSHKEHCTWSYIRDANEALEQLFEIVGKYKVARVKANNLNKARRYIRLQNGGLPQAKVDKMARLLLNKIKKSYEAAIY